jgi:hypothetical protein
MSSRLKMSSLVYEDIQCSNLKYKFGKAKLGEFNVIMIKENGYINATKVCTSGGKHFYKWSSTDKSKEMVQDLEKILKDSGSEDTSALIIVKGGDNPLVSGTYVHPDLIVHIASWVSTKFAFKVSKIVNTYYQQEYLYEINRQKAENKTLTGENKTLTGERNNAMAELKEYMRQNQLENKKMMTDHQIENKKIMTEHMTVLESMKETLDETKETLDETKETLDNTYARVDLLVEEVVPPAKSVCVREQFIVFRLNDKNKKYDYKVACVQKRAVSKTITSVKRSYPGSAVLLDIKPNANTKNILHRLKETYSCKKNKKINIKYNYINLVDGTDESELVSYINKIVDDKRKYSE